MATTAAAAAGLDNATANLRLTPETYTTIGTLLKANKDYVIPELVESYGDQGITGLLELHGAKKECTNNIFEHYEEDFNHNSFTATIVDNLGAGAVNGSTLTIDGVRTSFAQWLPIISAREPNQFVF